MIVTPGVQAPRGPESAMDYDGLVALLGTPRNTRHGTMFPDQPWHRIAELPNQEVTRRGDWVIVRIRLDGGTAMLFARIQPMSDGTQMLTHVCLHGLDHIVPQVAGMILEFLYERWERAEFTDT